MVNVREDGVENEDKPYLMSFKNVDCPERIIKQLKDSYKDFDESKCIYFQSLAGDSQYGDITKVNSILTSYFDWGEMG